MVDLHTTLIPEQRQRVSVEVALGAAAWAMGGRAAEPWSLWSPNTNACIEGELAKSQFVQEQIQPVAGWGRDWPTLQCMRIALGTERMVYGGGKCCQVLYAFMPSRSHGAVIAFPFRHDGITDRMSRDLTSSLLQLFLALLHLLPLWSSNHRKKYDYTIYSHGKTSSQKAQPRQNGPYN